MHFCQFYFYVYIENISTVRSQFGKAETGSHQLTNCDADEAVTFLCSSAGCSVNHCEALEV